MFKKISYILDIGSSSLTLFAVSKFNNQTRIIAEETVLYDGYMDGEFLTEQDLDEDLSKLISNLSSKLRKPINSITVGVPSEFCVCVCKRISRKYVLPHKLTEKDLANLYETNASFGDSEEYVVINYSPMQILLDDNYKTLKPVGKKTTSIVLDASFVLAKKSFVELIANKLHNLKVQEVVFISTALGQAMVCEPKQANKPFVVVDCGHISTSVAVYKGEGLALLSSFSMGGGHVSSDIMQVLNLSFKDAELIKRKVILTIESTKNDCYEICSKGSLIKAPINITNQIVKSRIEMIAKVIANILSLDDVFKDIDIYLTGDGISNFKGVKNIIKDITGLNTHEFKIPFDDTKDKFQTSKLGLATLANVE